jgi:hypothetical protein
MDGTGMEGIEIERKEGKSRKKILVVLIVIAAISVFAIYTLNLNIEAGNVVLFPAGGEITSQGNTQNANNQGQPQQSTPDIQMTGNKALVNETISISEPWSTSLYLEGGTYLRIDTDFDRPVKIEFFLPLQTGDYKNSFSQKGWVSSGKGGNYELRIIPETDAIGTVMLTELGRR